MPREDAPDAAKGPDAVSPVQFGNVNNAEDAALPGFLSKMDPRRRCAQCSCPMRPTPLVDTEMLPYSGERSDGTKFQSVRFRRTITRITGYGYKAAGVFCSLKCGYRYGMRQHAAKLAEAGRLARVVVECDGV